MDAAEVESSAEEGFESWTLDYNFSGVDSLCLDIEECFSQIDTASGAFAFNAQLTEYPQPGLTVEDVGLIGLPLNDASALEAASHQAPFGRGELTIIDPRVRDTCEINAEAVSFANPSWDHWVQTVVLPVVTLNLGLDAQARATTKAELYKVLLYRKGAMFKSHQDSEKAPGMFGTLVICLPTVHEGGQVLLSHGTETLRWASCKDSAYSLSYGAWYADVFHEVLPVTSGHRLVLTYNLINTSKDSEWLRTPHLDQPDLELGKIFRGWQNSAVSDKPHFGNYLCWALDHQYTDAALSFSNLKGIDRQIVSQARRVGDKTGVTVFLATVERTVNGSFDGWDEDERDENDICYDEWILQHMVDMDGNTVTGNIRVYQDSIIQEELFEGAKPYRQEESEYTGNEGATTTLWYRKAVMVLIPNKNVAGILIHNAVSYRSDVTCGTVISSMIKRYQQKADDTQQQEILSAALATCLELIEKASRHSDTMILHKFKDEDLMRIALGAFCIKDKACFDAILSRVRIPYSHLFYYSIGEMLNEDSLAEFGPGIAALLRKLDFIADRLHATGAMKLGLSRCENPATVEAFRNWSDELLEEFLLTMQPVDPDDGWTVASAAQERGPSFFMEKVVPWIRQGVFKSPFIFGFLSHLASFPLFLKNIPDRDSVFQELVSISLPHLQVVSLGGLDEAAVVQPKRCLWSGPPLKWKTPVGERKIIEHLSGSGLASILGELWVLGATDLAEQLLTTFSDQVAVAGLLSASLYPRMVVEFIQEFCQFLECNPHLPQQSEPKRTQLYRLLIGYLENYVGRVPITSPSVAMSGLRCSCRDCSRVSAFLRHPQQSVYRLTVNKERRHHVHQKLNFTSCTHLTDRTGSTHTMIIRKSRQGSRK